MSHRAYIPIVHSSNEEIVTENLETKHHTSERNKNDFLFSECLWRGSIEILDNNELYIVRKTIFVSILQLTPVYKMRIRI